MRVFGFVCLLACGSPTPTPVSGPPDRTASACHDLDSPDLAVRVAATRQLQPKVGAVAGGTEQQMDAAHAYCERTFAIPPANVGSAEPADRRGCFDACVAKRVKAGESNQTAEDECMQDCNSGE